MRITQILTALMIGCLVSGGLFGFAMGMGNGVFSLVLIGCSLLLAGMTCGWSIWKIRQGLNDLMLQAKSEQPLQINSGVNELDEVAAQFASLIGTARQASQADAKELAEVKMWLAKVDRRADVRDYNGQTITCLTQLRSILRGYGRQLDSNIRQAVACGREIRRATEEIVSGAEVQSDALHQTTTYMESLSARGIAVCDAASAAMKTSSKAEDRARKGLQVFENLIDEMNQIRNHAAARERKLQVLGQHTKEIESIVQTIGSLSSRTDLLALNASIESVRAGAHGRGFAIVAEEVRALAEQSAQAVLDITTRIEMIQLETHQSISVASSEHEQMQKMIARITETLNSIKEISSTVGDSAEGLSLITTATNQQLQLTQDIVSALERSQSASKKNRSLAEGVNWTSKTLGQLNSQLEGSLELFHLAGALTPSETEAPISHGPTRSTIEEKELTTV